MQSLIGIALALHWHCIGVTLALELNRFGVVNALAPHLYATKYANVDTDDFTPVSILSEGFQPSFGVFLVRLLAFVRSSWLCGIHVAHLLVICVVLCVCCCFVLEQLTWIIAYTFGTGA